MFLKEVYRHSKRIFVGMLFFIVLQLIINYKRGMVFTPFFHYGMYSWKQEPQREYMVNIVMINGDTLKGGQYSPQAWDKIHYTLDELYLTICQKDFFDKQIARLYTKAGLSRPYENHFIVPDNVPGLLQRYQTWLPGQLHLPAGGVQVRKHRYRYHFGRLIYQPEDTSLINNLPLCP
jgi:hypothetical protein